MVHSLMRKSVQNNSSNGRSDAPQEGTLNGGLNITLEV